jgi:CBS domain-containing protein
MTVKDVMTHNPTTVAPDTPLKEVARVLATMGISGVPVVDGGVVVGVVSEADILAKEHGEAPERRRLLGMLFEDGADLEAKLTARTAGEAMTQPAITIGPRRPVFEAAARMIDEGVNRLPVVDERGALVGIVTRADLVRAFLRTDAELAEEIREDVILQMLWIPPDDVGVSVAAGEVTLTGEVETQSEAELVEHFTRKVPGVVSVTSKLTWAQDNGEKRRSLRTAHRS